MPTRPLITGLLLAAAVTLALPANAALQARYLGSSTTVNAVYDTDLNVTWLTNANLMARNTFGLTYGNDICGWATVIKSEGTATWGGAQKWVTAMDAANYLGYSDWRLPTVSPINCSTFNTVYSATGTTDVGNNVSAPAPPTPATRAAIWPTCSSMNWATRPTATPLAQPRLAMV